MFMHEPLGPALRVSNAVAIVMLFVAGVRLRAHRGRARPWMVGSGDGRAGLRARRASPWRWEDRHAPGDSCCWRWHRSSGRSSTLAQDPPAAPSAAAGSRRSRDRRGPSPPLYFYQVVPTTATTCSRRSPPIATGCTSRRATTTRTSRPGSSWLGYNFSGGETLAWEFTPMLGGVFGDTTGVAPGFKASLGWRKLEFYSEGEYVIDTGSVCRQFLLQLVGADAGAGGVVALRPGHAAHARLRNGSRDPARPARGLLIQAVDLTGYLFNPDEDTPTFVFAVGRDVLNAFANPKRLRLSVSRPPCLARTPEPGSRSACGSTRSRR